MVVSKCNDCNASWICKDSTINKNESTENRESYIMFCKYYKSINESKDDILIPFDKDHIKPEFLKEAEKH